MSDKSNYTPILKWKRAEHRALKGLPASAKTSTTPLIEVVLPIVSRFKDKEQQVKKIDEEMLAEMVAKYRGVRLKQIPEEIASFWGEEPIYVDFSLIHDGRDTAKLKVESIETVIPAANAAGLHPILVINLNDESVIKDAARSVSQKQKRGVCVRVGASDLEDIAQLDKKLADFVVAVNLVHADVDLLVDLKDLQDGMEYARLFSQAQSIKSLNGWRSFIFASGAFPVDLGKIRLDEPTTIPRLDWINWLRQTSRSVNRVPTYSDYTIRTPLFDESLQFHHATTSIKYTIEDGWFVMKGKKHGYELFLANAKLLVDSTGHFYGENFSAGDKYIFDKSKHYDNYIKDPSIKGTGRNEDWISAGINHHLAVVANQVASLGKKVSHALSRSVIAGRK